MKVIGIGDNVVDRYTNKRIMFPGGNAVNFAVFAKKCGAEAAYLGLIADEEEGWFVYDSLKSLDIDLSRSYPVKGITTERCDVILSDGDRVFVGCEYGEGEWKPLKLTDEDIEYLEGFDAVHCGCYASMEDEIAKLKSLDAVKTYDFSAEPEYRTDEYLSKICPYIDIALFSAEEMDDDEAKAVQDKVISLGTKLVLVTHGIKGQTLYDGDSTYKGSVKRVGAVDTMGAGDSFFAAFVVALLRNGYTKNSSIKKIDMKRVFEYAAEFSASVCMTEGAFGFAAKY